ncbi:four helix bundle protein [Niabella aquatica]
MSKERIYDLEERLIEFASGIIDVVEKLPSSKAGNYISGQLVRCGLAPALLYGEVQSAESRNDFIHKMKIAIKELKETRICLKLIIRKAMIQTLTQMHAVMQGNEELIAILSKSVNTAKENSK